MKEARREAISQNPEAYADNWLKSIRRSVGLVQACVHPADQARVYPWVITYYFANDLANGLFAGSLLHQLNRPDKAQQSVQGFWLAFSQATAEFGGLLPTEAQQGIQAFVDLHHHRIKGLIEGDPRYCDRYLATAKEISADLTRFPQFLGISDEDYTFGRDIYRAIMALAKTAGRAVGQKLPEEELLQKFMAVFRQGRERFDWRIYPLKRQSAVDVRKLPDWVDRKTIAALTRFLDKVPMADKFQGYGHDDGKRIRGTILSRWVDRDLSKTNLDSANIAEAIFKQNPFRVSTLTGIFYAIMAIEKQFLENGVVATANEITEVRQQLFQKMTGKNWDIEANKLSAYGKMDLDEKYKFVQEFRGAVAKILADQPNTG